MITEIFKSAQGYEVVTYDQGRMIPDPAVTLTQTWAVPPDLKPEDEAAYLDKIQAEQELLWQSRFAPTERVKVR